MVIRIPDVSLSVASRLYLGRSKAVALLRSMFRKAEAECTSLVAAFIGDNYLGSDRVHCVTMPLLVLVLRYR